MEFDAWRDSYGSRRWWGRAETKAAVIQGNPPFTEKDVLEFCDMAEIAAAPVVGVLPELPSKAARRRVTARLAASGGRVLARVRPGGLRFIPFGFWSAREGRGGGSGCGTKSSVLLVLWHKKLSRGETAELMELLLACGSGRAWPDTSRETGYICRRLFDPECFFTLRRPHKPH